MQGEPDAARTSVKPQAEVDPSARVLLYSSAEPSTERRHGTAARLRHALGRRPQELIEELTEQENEVSYQRRLLQGRIDILRAERTARLKGKGVTDVDVEALTDILSSRSAPTEEGV